MKKSYIVRDGFQTLVYTCHLGHEGSTEQCIECKQQFGKGTFDGNRADMYNACPSPAFRVWMKMLNDYTIPMCDEWLLFSTFNEWVEQQDYKGNRFFCLDTEYCPERCYFQEVESVQRM